ncbi:beta-ketoacyl-ACP synthase III [Clostridium oryzae]|uniref:Beta-ketoacyl-[acyl-carrier-protein] synthase III n=1 Tax=Clostridium oryzae TaxID=1450648 RepID=A0A1V4IUY9_9CLOT|nr:beta-ketoacyl-ACP synthase III [Clostridium oryzae]OPJ63605.1 3-oxoacyl-[acyl-carrier-protein] synthase 3 [Clostridium oryzae]
MRNVKIKGTGRYVPDNIVTNFDLEKLVDTSDEWISTRTGIKERRISKGENTSDLAFKAAKKALESAEMSAEELDLIIVATVSPDAFTPATACIVQGLLGAKHAAAFDLNAACSGFVYAMQVAREMIKSGTYNNILIIGAEVLSKIIDWKDRNTCVLFGDGAGAIILSSSDEQGIMSIKLGADGSKGHALKCDAVPVNNAFMDQVNQQNKLRFISMEGREVFRFATTVMAEGIENILKDNSIDINEVKYIIPHQANYRIIDFTSKRLKVDISKFYINLQNYGNTSSATIPIALDELNEKGLLEKGDILIFVGFGGGLTHGAALVKW